MKRCWFGAVLLLVLLAGGIFIAVGMQDAHNAISSLLQQAANDALTENWTGADAAIGNARTLWQENWRFSASFADHEPMEQIDSLFAQIEIYQAQRDPVPLAALCAQLSRLVEAVGEAHAFTWWNIL